MTNNPISDAKLAEIEAHLVPYDLDDYPLTKVECLLILAELKRLRTPVDDLEMAEWVKTAQKSTSGNADYDRGYRYAVMLAEDIVRRLSARVAELTAERDGAFELLRGAAPYLDGSGYHRMAEKIRALTTTPTGEGR